MVSTSDTPAPPPILERLGARLFTRRARALGQVTRTDAIHYLNPGERAALRRIERGTVARAALAGALSGLASALAELATGELPALAASEWEALAGTWGVVLGVTLVATCFEIAFLYWDALRSVHQMARAAGVDLERGEALEQALLRPLVRAALELPNPAESVLGIHPFQEISRLRVVVATLVYKLKITVTNFLAKLLLRRLLGRAAVRAWLPLVAVPVTALWNGWVMWRVLREARLRVMGPFAAAEYLALILPTSARLSPAARALLVRAVGVAVTRKRDLHPNLVALLEQVRARVDLVEPPAVTDWRRFVDDLPALPVGEQRAVLQLLAVGVVLDGRLRARELEVLDAAHRAAGGALPRPALAALLRQFVRGDPVDQGVLAQLGALSAAPSPRGRA